MEVRELIELSFEEVSGFGPGIDVLGGGPYASSESGGFWGCLPPLTQWFQRPIFEDKCIRCVCEKLSLFPYVQYIVENFFSLAFWRYSHKWGFAKYLQNVKLISGADRHIFGHSSQASRVP